MTELAERLDALAREGTRGVQLVHPELAVRRRHRRRTRNGLAVGLAAAVVAIVVVGVAGNERHGPASTVQVESASTVPAPGTSLPPTPEGWSRYSHGALSVAVPPGWTFDGSPPGLCYSRPLKSVYVGSFETVSPGTNCTFQAGPPPASAYIELDCYTGSAAHLVSSPTTTVINGQSLQVSDVSGGLYRLVASQPNQETVLSISLTGENDSDLVSAIETTVAATGRSC